MNVNEFNYIFTELLLNEYGILCGKWCYQKEGEFHVIDEDSHEEKRENALPSGNVLLRLCEGAYHICTASQKDKSSLYPIKDSKFLLFMRIMNIMNFII